MYADRAELSLLRAEVAELRDLVSGLLGRPVLPEHGVGTAQFDHHSDDDLIDMGLYRCETCGVVMMPDGTKPTPCPKADQSD